MPLQRRAIERSMVATVKVLQAYCVTRVLHFTSANRLRRDNRQMTATLMA